MTVRVCFIGNSHLAAIKLGIDRVGGVFPDLRPTYFGAPKVGLQSLVPRGRRLITRDRKVAAHMRAISGGAEAIDLDAYDRFVVVGLGFGLGPATMPVYARHRSQAMDWRHADHLVSEGCFARAVAGRVAQSLALRLAGLIHAARPELPITIIPHPLVSQSAVSWTPTRWVRFLTRGRRRDIRADDGSKQLWQALLWSGDAGPVAAAYHAALAGLPPYAVVHAQPAETVTREVLTRKVFHDGARRMDMERQHEDTDITHMNAAYGALVVRSLLPRLGVAAASG